MIPKLFKAGKSFKGVFRYLSTDPKSNTAERVNWTHTLNCAYDDVASALDEMIWTARSADWLKRQAGVATGGSKLKDPVRHFSLNWHKSEAPTREHVIETVEAFLKHMKWNEHQAVLFNHTDKQHAHVHVVVNAVHPETGRALDSRFDRERAQRWALAYEKEHELFCEQRLRPEGDREPAPTREAWMKLKEAERQFEQAEAARMVRAPDYIERGDPAHWKAKEWDALRDYHKEQRTDFFTEGKPAYREVRNAVFREIRTEFRDQWKVWFQMRREGADLDLLGAIKAGILERQNGEMERRRDEACKELREKRDKEYQDLLRQQREQRAQLKERQSEDLRTYDLLDRQYKHDTKGPDQSPEAQRARENLRDDFASAARETTNPQEPEREERREHEPDLDEAPGHERHKVRDPLDAAGLLGLGALGAIADLGERLFDGFMGGAPQKPPRQPPQPRPDTGHQRARSSKQQQGAQEDLAEEAARLHAFWEERRRRRTRDRD